MKMYQFLLLSITFLTSCSPPKSKPDELPVELDYDLVEPAKIQWSDIFSQTQETYKVYFYSLQCGYCQELKETIISYYLEGKETLYFVCTDEYAVFGVGDIIGINKIDDFYILGTPSLVEITNSTVSNNYAGLSSIKSYLQK